MPTKHQGRYLANRNAQLKKPTGTACDSAAPADLRARMKGKNINEESLLATDYLNHFGEFIMLLEMGAMMPECLDEVQDWTAKSYAEHFQSSRLSDPEVYIEAYDASPVEYRVPFDETIAEMLDSADSGLREILSLAEAEDSNRLELMIEQVVAHLRALNDQAAAIVNGEPNSSDQADIDSIMNG